MKEALIFIGGIGLGAAASALFFKKFFEKKEADDVAKFKAEYKEQYAAEFAKLQETRSRLIQEVENVNQIGKKIAEERLGIGRKKQNTDKVNYTEMYEKADPAESIGPSEEDDDQDYIDSKQMNDDAKAEKGIVIISESECGENPCLEPLEFTFYYDDGVLADDNDEAINDPGYYIGSMIEDSGFDRNDDTQLCVRNYDIGADITITKAWSKYDDVR